MTQNMVWDSYYRKSNFFTRILKRFTGACRMIFLGRIEVEGNLILSGEDHVQAFISALQEGLKKLEANQDD